MAVKKAPETATDTEVYSERYLTSKIESFAIKNNNWKPLVFFTKNSVLDVWQVSEHTSETDLSSKIFQLEILQNTRDGSLWTLLTISFWKVLSINLEFLFTFQTYPDSCLNFEVHWSESCNT